MKLIKTFWPAILIIMFPGSFRCGPGPGSNGRKRVTVKAVNKLSIARPSQTIEIMAKDLAPLGEKDLNKMHVWDAAGRSYLASP